VQVDSVRLADVIVHEIQFRQPRERGHPSDDFELGHDATADHLLGWNPIDFVRKYAHKFNPPAGDNEGLEAMGTQISEQLQHRLEDQFGV
jgi:hypothetical protein